MATIPVIFISYSHESDDHRRKVRRLSERLRKDGLVTFLDQYINGAPENGWPRWMLDRLEDANFVLLVCTETYYERFRGKEVRNKGKGVDWEGALITQELYDSKSSTLKFVPILFDNDDVKFIPEPLRGKGYYSLVNEEQYQKLYNFLLNRDGWEPGPVGEIIPMLRPTESPMEFSGGGTIRENVASGDYDPSTPTNGVGFKKIPPADLDRRGWLLTTTLAVVWIAIAIGIAIVKWPSISDRFGGVKPPPPPVNDPAPPDSGPPPGEIKEPPKPIKDLDLTKVTVTNGTSKSIELYIFPHLYDGDVRPASWQRFPVIGPMNVGPENPYQSDDLKGGHYFVVIRDIDSKIDARVGWRDFGWRSTRTLVISSDLFETPDADLNDGQGAHIE